MNVFAHVGDAGRDPLQFHLHPDVVAVVVAVALGYWFALKRLGPRLASPGEPVITRRQSLMLVAAIGGLWLASDWPLHDLGAGYLYSAHMVQHSIYTVALPPLFILGTPAWLWRWLLRPVMPVFRRLVHPVSAVAIFSAVTVVTHVPVFVTAAVRSGPAHVAQHAALILSATLVWWPVTSPLPEVGRLSKLLSRLVYPFFQFLAASMAGSSLVWAQEPVYRVYDEFPKLWGFTTLSDQQWAGAIMGGVEGGAMGVLMLIVMLHVARQQRATATVALRPREAAGHG